MGSFSLALLALKESDCTCDGDLDQQYQIVITKKLYRYSCDVLWCYKHHVSL